MPVLVYRDHLLPFSEVWVRAQAEAMTRYEPWYAGSKRVAQVPLPEARVFALNGGTPWGRAAEIAFKLTLRSRALRRWARRLRPALIHAHYGIDGMLLAPLARALGVPLVVSFHGFEAMMREEAARRSFYLHRKYLDARPRLARQGSLFVAVSDYLRRRLLDQGFPPERTVTHYIGVDTDLFTRDPRVQRCPIVLFVGRLCRLKGCDRLLAAMAAVARTRPEVELVVVGDGPERAALERLARAQAVRALFLGMQPQDKVRWWMNRASVLAVPSITLETTECESFGLVCAEAQAMGLPVAAYDSGGLREAVAHGQTGLLAPEGDVAALAANIAELLANDALWRRMSAAGQARTRREFDVRRQTGALEAMYDEVLRTHSVPAGAPRARRRQAGAAAHIAGRPAA